MAASALITELYYERSIRLPFDDVLRDVREHLPETDGAPDGTRLMHREAQAPAPGIPTVCSRC